ncbi:MAG: leucine-rich repeat domain-containing protein [Alistipes sp.]|nr:leucine-rich repeat domain-containing protein [Alistipes sp.]
MKKLLLLLAAVGMIFTACEAGGGLDENGNGNPSGTEQPGGGNQGGEEIPADKTHAIKFQDENTKLLCTLHWDENEDGELSYEEAAAVTDLGTAFKGSSILDFTELKYFTSLEKIADSAFMGCASLVKITLPEQLTIIGASAFNSCTNLKKIAIPNAVTEIGDHTFSGCYSLASITIPDSVAKIGDSAFGACTSLTSITIPDSVTSIGSSAFSGCSSLTSVTIPDSVTSIGSSAFSGCSSLTSVYCKPTTPPTFGSGALPTNNASLIIYVPTDSVNAYKAKDGWKDYADYIKPYNF